MLMAPLAPAVWPWPTQSLYDSILYCSNSSRMTGGLFMTFPYFFASLVSTTARNWDERHGIAEAAQFRHFDCPLVSFSEFDPKGTLCITALCLCPQLFSLGHPYASWDIGHRSRIFRKLPGWKLRLPHHWQGQAMARAASNIPKKTRKSHTGAHWSSLELTGAHWSWVLCILYLANWFKLGVLGGP